MRKIISFDNQTRRKARVGANIIGRSDKPRISVFRSNRYIYLQAIDDDKRVSLCSYSSRQLPKETKDKKISKKDQAKLVGAKLAEILKSKVINEAVFDRGSYKYHGRVKAAAEGLREGGIKI